MKVYLDDLRMTPEGWTRAYWPDEVIAYLKTGEVTEISLDHDLGDDKRGTGYDVLEWIEKETATNNFDPPIISIHTANVSARLKMMAAVESIRRFTA